MFHSMISEEYSSLLALSGILFAFVATVAAIAKLGRYLPKDAGREFAVDGKLSAGKPRGAGIIFVLAFVASALLFVPMKPELVIHLILTVICMVTGFLDDASEKPWGELKKGILDLCVAILVAMTFLHYNDNTIRLALFQRAELVIPKALFAVLIVALVWVSVNVTNCADGVDGLSGTLAIISIMTIYVVDRILGTGQDFSFLILLFAACILGYLWYNATPSRLLTGDAGSRAMGLSNQHRHLEERQPYPVYPHRAGADTGRRPGADKGRADPCLRHPYHDEDTHAPARPGAQGLGLVQHPDSVPLRHHPDYPGGGGGIRNRPVKSGTGTTKGIKK